MGFLVNPIKKPADFTYSVRNKHSPTLINFLSFFQGLQPYSGLHRDYFSSISKVNSKQEACTKCFVVYLLNFEILEITWKNQKKTIKMQNLLVKNWKLGVSRLLFHYFYVICRISNFNMWTTKYLAKASCTELTL